MQSNKSSNKTGKSAADAITSAGTEKNKATEVKTSPRTPKSSKPKSETSEPLSTAAKHHHKATPSKGTPAVEKAATPKVMAAAVGANSLPTSAVVVDPVGVEVPTTATSTSVVSQDISQEQIAALAHSYYVARGSRHGSHEEDWTRAEFELKTRR